MTSSPALTSILVSATLAATSTLTSTSAMAATLISSHPKPDPDDTGECKLLGPFAVLVQVALGGLALLALVYKRWRERPQRPVKVWAFDVSKQVVGSVLLHMANLFMSLFSAGEIRNSVMKAAAKAAAVAASTAAAADGNAGGAGGDREIYSPNPCSFYLLNLGIDTTAGIAVLFCILKVLHVGARYTPLARPPESIESGNYGEPPHVTWWLKQSVIYFCGLLGMKACVFLLFELCPWIVVVGDWALRWTEGNEAIQVTFVMFIFPLIMNAMQYYIIDTFIKQKKQIQLGKGDDDVAGGGLERGDEDEEGGLLAEDHDDHGTIVSIGPDEAYTKKSTGVEVQETDTNGKTGGTRSPNAESSSTATTRVGEETALAQKPLEL